MKWEPWSPDILLHIPQFKSALVPEAISSQKQVTLFPSPSHTAALEFLSQCELIAQRWGPHPAPRPPPPFPESEMMLPALQPVALAALGPLRNAESRAPDYWAGSSGKGPRNLYFNQPSEHFLRLEHQEVPENMDKLLVPVKESVCHLVDTQGMCVLIPFLERTLGSHLSLSILDGSSL